MRISFAFVDEWTGPWREYLAEFVGTFLFVFLSSSLVLVPKMYDLSPISVPVGIAFGYTALIFATSHLSGGYLNPAVTLSLWIVKRLTGARTVFYIISQCLASLAAAYLVLFIFGDRVIDLKLGVSSLGLGVSANVALILEALFTAGLVFAVFSSMIDKNGPVSFGPLVLGLYLASCGLVAFPLTGAVFNPARVIGPLVVAKSFSSLAIYVIGPMVGSLTGLFYEYVFIRRVSKK